MKRRVTLVGRCARSLEMMQRGCRNSYGIGDNYSLIVAGDFQTETGFRLFDLLVGRHWSFHFHTAREQNFSGVDPASCNETATKGLPGEVEAP